MELNIIDEMLLHVFKGYSYKIYKFGVRDGFNWKSQKNKISHFLAN